MTTEQLSRLTPEAKRIAIAQACGADRFFTLKKRGYFYRPDAKGYTANESEAWKVTEDIADQHVYPKDDPVTKHPATLPDYLNDLNAMHSAEEIFSDSEYDKYSDNLDDVILEDVLTHQGKLPLRSQYSQSSTAAQRADAFLLTLP